LGGKKKRKQFLLAHNDTIIMRFPTLVLPTQVQRVGEYITISAITAPLAHVLLNIKLYIIY